MNVLDRLCQISDLFRYSKTIEELTALRDQYRLEVRLMPNDCIRWLLDEWQQARRMFDLGCDVKGIKKWERDEAKRNHNKCDSESSNSGS